VTKKEAIKLVCGNKGTARQLAEKLGISVQAVSAWKASQIPKLREFEIKDLLKASE
jgi:transcriptional regulator with XRE-family HTH domain